MPEHRHQSLGEEIANSVSHGVGLLGALAAAPILIVAAAKTGEALTVVSVSIFATTIVLVYASSTIYHFLPRGILPFRLAPLHHCWYHLPCLCRPVVRGLVLR